MRNDPSPRPGTRNSDTIGLAGVLTGYAALAAILLFFVVLLVAGHRHTATPKQAQLQDDYFGVEELVDLLAAGVPPVDLFVLPKPRPITRAELDLKQSR